MKTKRIISLFTDRLGIGFEAVDPFLSQDVFDGGVGGDSSSPGLGEARGPIGFFCLWFVFDCDCISSVDAVSHSDK